MLLDSASLYFRAFHGVPESVTAPDGTPVNAVRGFLDSIAFLVRERKPDRLVACLDLDWRPKFRTDAVPSYKAHRVSPKGGETVPDTLVPQVPIILDVLGALGIAAVGSEGFEADDVIGTIAHRARGPVEVVSGDRDLFQVVRDKPPVHVLYVGKGVRKYEAMGEAEVEAKYGVPGPRYADFAVLRGDPSDGLPGVKGVGEKSAAALISKFGSLDAMVAALDAGTEAGFPAGARTKLAESRDYLEAAPAVARVRTDCPLPAYDDALPKEPAHPRKLVDLGERWGLDNTFNRLLAALAG
ncbi:MAG TPA: 5'-3' exonuclease [Mycobacteriales bacterium]|nr:5'-3' exonuclease [Mycobacteriales bacterium]